MKVGIQVKGEKDDTAKDKYNQKKYDYKQSIYIFQVKPLVLYLQTIIDIMSFSSTLKKKKDLSPLYNKKIPNHKIKLS